MATKSARPRQSAAVKTTLKTSEKPIQTASSTTTTSTAADDLLSSLKSQYKSQLNSLHELFADWNDEDLVAVLQEVRGDLEIAILRISEGHAQQWSTGGKKTRKDVKKSENVEDSSYTGGNKASSGNFRSSSHSTRGRDVPSRGRGRGRGSSRPVSSRPLQNDTPQSYSASDKPSSWGSEFTSTSKTAVAPTAADSWGQSAEASSSSWAAEPVDSKASWAAPTTNSSGKEDRGWGKKESMSSSSWADPVKSVSTSPTAISAAQATVTASSLPPPSKPVKKGTWAEIAKPPPEPPKPQHAPVKPVVESKPVREPSPKRSVSPRKPAVHEKVAVVSPSSPQNPSSAAVHSVVESNVSQKPSSFPPGLTSSPSRANAQTQPAKLKKDTPVVLPSNPNTVGSVGVTFGSLSLNSDSEAIEAKKTPIIASRNATGSQSAYLKEQSMKESAPVVPPQVSHYYQQPAEYPGYDRSATEQAQQQQQPGMPYPPNMTAANMASMYAAYFPIYMNHLNQFGANPYAQTNPAAAHYNQAFTAAMNKNFMYPPTQANGAPTAGVPPQGGQKQGQQQSQMPYNAYYNMAMPMGEDVAQEYAKYQSAYQQAAYQQAAAQQKDKGDKNGSGQNIGVNPYAQTNPYYSQMMHGYGHPHQQHQQQQQQSHGRQPPYWDNQQ